VYTCVHFTCYIFTLCIGDAADPTAEPTDADGDGDGDAAGADATAEPTGVLSYAFTIVAVVVVVDASCSCSDVRLFSVACYVGVFTYYCAPYTRKCALALPCTHTTCICQCCSVRHAFIRSSMTIQCYAYTHTHTHI
jgi:hypothetical protein